MIPLKIEKIILFLLTFTSSLAFAELKIGVYFYPPYVISSKMGFDIELSRTLCQRLNENCQFISVGLAELFDALDRGKIDLAIGGIDISKNMQANYIFSLPYLMSTGDFLVLKKSPIKYISQMNGKKIGIIQNEKEQDSYSLYNNIQLKYEVQFIIVKYNNIEDMLAALISEDISAALIHDKAAHYWEKNGGNQFKVFNVHLVIGNGVAIIALPKNKILIDNINRQLINIEQDGTYLNIYNAFFSDK